jgi:hypothetical protein
VRTTMWAERIKRGFHRVGVILVAICLVMGAMAFLFGAYQWAEPLVRAPIFEVSGPDGKRLTVRYGTEPKEIGARIKELYDSQSDRRKMVDLLDGEFSRIDSQKEDGTHWMLGSLISLVVAAALYGMSRALGWILAGFLGD